MAKQVKTFATIVIDPPWIYQNFSSKKQGAARSHYDGDVAEDIAKIPVRKWMRKDSTVFVWATLPKLDKAIDVIRAWDLNLVTAFPWVKTSPKKGTIRTGIGMWAQSAAELLLVCRPIKGTGRAPKQKDNEKVIGLLQDGISGGQYEGDYSIAVRKSNNIMNQINDFREAHGIVPSHGNVVDMLTGSFGKQAAVFYAPVGHHSRKPLSLVEWIEARMPGPRLELYATSCKPGWTTWGHSLGTHLCEEGVVKYDPKIHGK